MGEDKARDTPAGCVLDEKFCDNAAEPSANPSEADESNESGAASPFEETQACDEPSAEERCSTIALGALCSGAAYGCCRLALSTEHTEDAVDMVHSLASSSVALYGFASMEPHKQHTRALPASLAHGRGPVVRMFALSLGYFFADFLKITVDVVIRKRFPNLWLGRLIHHLVQLGANSPALFCEGKPRDQVLAWRSVLCMAYIAEVSSIFLRLSNMLRSKAPGGARGLKLQKAVNWALVLSFFLSRILNFPFAIAMFVKARPCLPPTLFRLGAAVQASGYALSTVWFTKIVRIALKTSMTTVPSMEC